MLRVPHVLSPAVKRLKGLLAGVAIALATFVGVALVGEAGLRLAGSWRAAGERERLTAYASSRTLSHRLRPDWEARFAYNDFDTLVRTNHLGFRSAEPRGDARDERSRILVLGDSFAFGWGVENDETFSAVLERGLASRGRPAEVWNAGVPGYSADQHYVFLRDEGFALLPDLILLAVCSNDTHELAWKQLTLDARGLPTSVRSKRHFINRRGEMRFLNDSLLDLPSLPIPTSWDGWLYENSWAFNWLRIRLVKAWAGAATRYREASWELPSDQVPTGALENLGSDAIHRGLAGSAAFRLRYHRELIAAIGAEAAAREIPLRFVLTSGSEAGLEADCAESACLDQTQVFRREDDPETHLPKDGHWSPKGHRLLGEALADWLVDEL